MDLAKICSSRILLVGMGFWAVCGSVSAQTWRQDVWQDGPAADRATASPVDWQQRVLRQPMALKQPTEEGSAGWHAAAQDTSSDHNVFVSATMPADPSANGRQQVKWISGGQQPEVIPPGNVEIAPMAKDGMFAGQGFPGHAGCATCGGPGDETCGCDECDGGQCGGSACGECCDFGWEIFDGHCGPWLRGLSLFAGFDGFKGPADRGTNGNFGMNEGLNLARPLGDPWECGYQIGANFVQSDLSGAPTVTANDTTLSASYRRQTFITAGLFRRALCRGWQGGVAFDYLHDDFYQMYDLKQMRSELSFVFNDACELGYYGAYGLGSAPVVDGKVSPTDMFVLYLRHNFENGGDGRLWGGTTNNGDGLLGGELWVPLGKGFALENRVNYLIPRQGTGTTAQPREAWGLLIQLVWYPGQNARCQQQNPYRPIFDVADNSLFMVDRVAR